MRARSVEAKSITGGKCFFNLLKLLGSRPGNRLKNIFGLTKPVLLLLLCPTEYANNITFLIRSGDYVSVHVWTPELLLL